MARVTKDRLNRWRELKAKSAELGSQKQSIDEEIRQIEGEATSDLEATGKDSAKRGGFTLTWKESNGSVAWKSEFIRVSGADEANRIVSEQPKKRKLIISSPPDA